MKNKNTKTLKKILELYHSLKRSNTLLVTIGPAKVDKNQLQNILGEPVYFLS